MDYDVVDQGGRVGPFEEVIAGSLLLASGLLLVTSSDRPRGL
jgi:hypothetical protein